MDEKTPIHFSAARISSHMIKLVLWSGSSCSIAKVATDFLLYTLTIHSLIYGPSILSQFWLSSKIHKNTVLATALEDYIWSKGSIFLPDMKLIVSGSSVLWMIQDLLS